MDTYDVHRGNRDHQSPSPSPSPSPSTMPGSYLPELEECIVTPRDLSPAPEYFMTGGAGPSPSQYSHFPIPATLAARIAQSAQAAQDPAVAAAEADVSMLDIDDHVAATNLTAATGARRLGFIFKVVIRNVPAIPTLPILPTISTVPLSKSRALARLRGFRPLATVINKVASYWRGSPSSQQAVQQGTPVRVAAVPVDRPGSNKRIFLNADDTTEKLEATLSSHIPGAWPDQPAPTQLASDPLFDHRYVEHSSIRSKELGYGHKPNKHAKATCSKRGLVMLEYVYFNQGRRTGEPYIDFHTGLKNHPLRKALARAVYKEQHPVIIKPTPPGLDIYKLKRVYHERWLQEQKKIWELDQEQRAMPPSPTRVLPNWDVTRHDEVFDEHNQEVPDEDYLEAGEMPKSPPLAVDVDMSTLDDAPPIKKVTFKENPFLRDPDSPWNWDKHAVLTEERLLYDNLPITQQPEHVFGIQVPRPAPVDEDEEKKVAKKKFDENVVAEKKVVQKQDEEKNKESNEENNENKNINKNENDDDENPDEFILSFLEADEQSPSRFPNYINQSPEKKDDVADDVEMKPLMDVMGHWSLKGPETQMNESMRKEKESRAREKQEEQDRLKAEEEARRKAEEEAAAEKLRVEQEEAARLAEIAAQSARPIISQVSADAEECIREAAEKGPTATHAGYIKGQSFGTLLPSMFAGGNSAAWLDDEIVNGFLKMLAEREQSRAGWKKAGGNGPPVQAFASQWYNNIKEAGKAGGSEFEKVKRWHSRAGLNGRRILDTELILIPICEGSHWRLLVIRPTAREVEYLDSLYPSAEERRRYIDIARRFLKFELGALYRPEDWTDVENRSGKQLNSSDCGVFTGFNAMALVMGMVPREKVKGHEMEMARVQMAATLLQGSFDGEFDY